MPALWYILATMDRNPLFLCFFLVLFLSHFPLLAQEEETLKQAVAGRFFLSSDYLDLLDDVPRERFFSEDLSPFCNSDRPLPDGDAGISPAPSTILHIFSSLDLQADDRFLIIGRAGAYTAALASARGARVTLLEYGPAAERYQKLFSELETPVFLIDDLQLLVSEDGQEVFDKIFIHEGLSASDARISRLLREGGRAVFPLQAAGGAYTCVLYRDLAEGFRLESLGTGHFEAAR